MEPEELHRDENHDKCLEGDCWTEWMNSTSARRRDLQFAQAIDENERVVEKLSGTRKESTSNEDILADRGGYESLKELDQWPTWIEEDSFTKVVQDIDRALQDLQEWKKKREDKLPNVQVENMEQRLSVEGEEMQARQDMENLSMEANQVDKLPVIENDEKDKMPLHELCSKQKTEDVINELWSSAASLMTSPIHEERIKDLREEVESLRQCGDHPDKEARLYCERAMVLEQELNDLDQQLGTLLQETESWSR